jgi:hypothetical protein
MQMLLLEAKIDLLAEDLLAVPMRIGQYHDLPFAILRYEPAEEWKLRRQLTLLENRLQAADMRTARLSLAALLWEAIDASEGPDAIVELERSRGFEEAQRQVTTYLSDPDWCDLPGLVVRHIEALSPPPHVVFLYRAGAMAPAAYHMSKLLDELHGKPASRSSSVTPAHSNRARPRGCASWTLIAKPRGTIASRSMDEKLLGPIHDLALEARRLLMTEAEELLEGVYGLPRQSATPASPNDQVRADPELLETHARLARWLADEVAAGHSPQRAYDKLVKETAFTHLNRCVAFKMMETRRLIRGTLDRRARLQRLQVLPGRQRRRPGPVREGRRSAQRSR